ncbi:proline-rich receptor-like protein kinase PERK12 [Iris pallida]|uniref:Proline-rich receptor-like protein kinase PERK12 n=1 Tax=Iris pallida TaxID=29817 RepID=A0AAX6FPJ5_IRIPA|nr:proline-rich receptor-like protein kinase PERK12 [Iris pallida]
MSWQAKPRPPSSSPPGPASPPTTGLQAVGHRRLLHLFLPPTPSHLLFKPPDHLHATPTAANTFISTPSPAPSSAWLAVRSPVRSRATAAAAMRQETRASERETPPPTSRRDPRRPRRGWPPSGRAPAYLPMAANVLRDAPSRRFVRFARRPVVTRASLELRFDAPSQRLRTRFPEDPTVGSAISSLRRNLVLRGQLRQLVSPPP